MKKRTFYVVNLDRSRILTLGVVFAGFVLVAFATGFRFGKNNNQTAAPNTVGLNNNNEGAGTPGSDRFGPSIYSLNRGPGNGDASNPNKTDMPGTDSENSTDNDKPDPRADKPDIDRSLNLNPEPSGRDAGDDVSDRSSEPRDRSQSNADAARKREQKRRAAKEHESELKRLAERKRELREERDRLRKERVAANSRRASRDPGHSSDPRAAVLDLRGEVRKFSNPSSKPSLRDNSDKPKRTEEKKEKSTIGGELRERSGAQYTLQVGSYKYRKSADRKMETLRRQGFQPSLSRSQGMYRVTVGHASSSDELGNLRGRLRGNRHKAITIRSK